MVAMIRNTDRALVSVDVKKALLALIWALKASDLSILLGMLRRAEDSYVGLKKRSAHHIFWTKLEEYGLAVERDNPLDPSTFSIAKIVRDTPPEYLAGLTNHSAYGFTPQGKTIIDGGVALALNTGWPPKDAIVIPEVVRMLEDYSADGTAEADNKLGALYRDGKGVRHDHVEALKWFRKAADKGDRTAYNNIGIMYSVGLGVQKDLGEAAMWFRKGAELGSVGAMENLGTLHASGQGVPIDFTEAAKWWRRSAERGYAQAQCKLATLYAQGRGVPQDNVQAYIWFSLGLARGIDVRQPRDIVASRMTKQQIEEANSTLGQWKPLEDKQQ